MQETVLDQLKAHSSILAEDLTAKVFVMKPLAKLKEMSDFAKKRGTVGLKEAVIKKFLDLDPLLEEAIDKAYLEHKKLRTEFGALLKSSEQEQIEELQKGFVNFYDNLAVNPYVALAAKGPWVVTSCGAVLHDSGGYGMLGFGHAPKPILDALAEEQVMANIMTASFSQKRFISLLEQEVGHRRSGKQRHPYARFICLNSGSESMTIATRITDRLAMVQTDPGGKHAGKTIKFLSMKGSFHGRTERPSQISDSSIGKYKQYLASYRSYDQLVTVPPNDLQALEQAFAQADRDKVYFEAMILEPVMGEGNPGLATSPEFYALARKLTAERGVPLIVDSIQAGLRAHGYLSLCDYPGFEHLDAPDLETYSKALNAGQYPLSVLALNEKMAKLYATGLYGNTMTTNPRALDVACAVLQQLTPKLRENIRKRGQEFLDHFQALKKEFPQLITHVQGTGLLFSLGIHKDKAEVVGERGLEVRLRENGIGVIHGGENALRFTPHFAITGEEIQLIVGVMREIFAGLR